MKLVSLNIFVSIKLRFSESKNLSGRLSQIWGLFRKHEQDKLVHSNFVHFYKNGKKLKIFCEIQPPLYSSYIRILFQFVHKITMLFLKRFRHIVVSWKQRQVLVGDEHIFLQVNRYLSYQQFYGHQFKKEKIIPCPLPSNEL